MNAREPTPEPWAKRMIEKGMTHNGEPSYTRLASKANVGVETVRRAIRGRGQPSPETMMAIMNALGDDVQNWFGVDASLGVYRPPSEAALLTRRQRDAIDALIRAIVDGRPASTREADRDALGAAVAAELDEERQRRQPR